MGTTWHTLYVWPLVIGVLIALASPWIKLLGSWLANVPTRHLRGFQSSEAHTHRLGQLEHAIAEVEKKAELERAKASSDAERENRAIDAAKRLDEARELGQGEVASEIERQREAGKKEVARGDLPRELSDLQLVLMTILATQREAVTIGQLSLDSEAKDRLRTVLPFLTDVRAEVELGDGFENLGKLGLVNMSASGRWTLTSKGYEIVDNLPV